VVVLSVIYPVVGRVALRAVATVALGLGTALAVWPTVCLIRGERLRAINLPLPGSSIAEVGESYGWSGCLLVIGGLVLGFSFLGKRRKPAEAPPGEKTLEKEITRTD
jgi:hypothetical protein